MILHSINSGEQMVRYLGPKNRIARRFGANIFGRSRNPLLKRANPPGQHGARRRKKSDFGLQLEEKQKLKACYGMMTEKQLVNYFQKAVSQEGNTAQLFLEKLECRLDNVVYRLNFATTIFGAQQLVSHGHVLVNGKKVDCRSFQVQPGMVISIKEKSRKIPVINDVVQAAARIVPDYLTLDKENFKGTLVLTPSLDQIVNLLPLPINIPLVCDFLSHQH